MATLERTYNVPLRKQFLKVPRYQRAKKAVTALRQFLAKHMKSDTILIGRHLNMKIWSRGIKNPPHHVSVNAVKDDKGTVMAELVGAPKPVVKDEKAKKTAQKKETTIKQEAEELKKALAGELKEAEVMEQAEKHGASEDEAEKKAANDKLFRPKKAAEKIEQ